jgi:hypothetical protein
MVEFQRGDQRVPDHGARPTPLTWDYAKRYRQHRVADHDLVLSTCSEGHTCRLVSTVHQIATDGTISPSYACPVSGCKFHTMVRLVGWDPAHTFEYYDADSPV